MTSTTLLLSRHGRTEWSADGRYAGASEIDLDDVGREQAGRLARWAAGAQLDAIRCSPMVRAVATATGTAHAAGLELVRDARLRELDFGAAEGRRLDELRTEHPQSVRAFERDPVAHPLPGGEDPAAAAHRAAAALRDAAAAAPGGRVLVVAHNTILRLALCELLGIELGAYRRALPRIDHDALAEISLGARGAGLRRLNAPLRDPTRASGR
ncbi:histidine phosphatase family protein [Conexibacter sp. CPCC 206217]|uniref:histidine phosphatase family protein n=1 Tax=Conexibacter sp. CPCC 206217 TaxID=3064574 RepID=UPI0027261B89|nr:histidine phosphatase family protein [Conexibacter sp. CPCC 206217]MDO8213184.1 histidine phosphatase family protein [Conexibacter sp. CPCC 206217]